MRDVDAGGHLVKRIRSEGDMVLAGKFGLTPADQAGMDLPKPAPTELPPLDEARRAARWTRQT